MTWLLSGRRLPERVPMEDWEREAAATMSEDSDDDRAVGAADRCARRDVIVRLQLSDAHTRLLERSWHGSG